MLERARCVVKIVGILVMMLIALKIAVHLEGIDRSIDGVSSKMLRRSSRY